MVTFSPSLAFKTAFDAPVDLFWVELVAVKPIIFIALRVAPALTTTTSDHYLLTHLDH